MNTEIEMLEMNVINFVTVLTPDSIRHGRFLPKPLGNTNKCTFPCCLNVLLLVFQNEYSNSFDKIIMSGTIIQWADEWRLYTTIISQQYKVTDLFLERRVGWVRVTRTLSRWRKTAKYLLFFFRYDIYSYFLKLIQDIVRPNNNVRLPSVIHFVFYYNIWKSTSHQTIGFSTNLIETFFFSLLPKNVFNFRPVCVMIPRVTVFDYKTYTGSFDLFYRRYFVGSAFFC